MSIIQAILLAIIEGITEFLPISSTGHMVIASSFMGIAEQDFTKTYTVAIQLGAILSVVALYWKKFFQTTEFYIKLFIAFIPVLILGGLLHKYIDALLENPVVVGASLLTGGIIFLFVDKWFEATEVKGASEVKRLSALKIGLFQTIAMIPGVSRSAATIIGGLTQKLNRKTAAEFSFFLAVPTMFAATVKKLYDFYKSQHALQLANHTTGPIISHHEIKLLLLGNAIAFIVALFAIRGFINFLTKYGFKGFGYYRIVIGLAILFLYFFGFGLNVV